MDEGKRFDVHPLVPKPSLAPKDAKRKILGEEAGAESQESQADVEGVNREAAESGTRQTGAAGGEAPIIEAEYEVIPDNMEPVKAERVEADAERDAEAAVEVLTADTPAVEAGVRTAAPDATPEQVQQATQAITSPEGKRRFRDRLKDTIKSVFKGKGAAFVAGAATSTAIRVAITSAWGSSFWVWGTAGAISGAAVEGVKGYRRESKQASTEDVLAKLTRSSTAEGGEKSLTDQAAILAKAKEALGQAIDRKDQEKEQALRAAIVEAQARLQAKIDSPEMANASERDKALHILKISEGARKEVPRKERKEAQKLIKKIEFLQEKSKVRWGKVVKSAAIGAGVGFVGGLVGYEGSQLLTHYLHGGATAVNEALSQEAQAQKTQAALEAGREASRNLLKEARNKLLEQKFTEIAHKGENLTRMARNAVHDYLYNQAALDAASSQSPVGALSPEQLVYAEDTLVKTFLTQAHHGPVDLVHPGDSISLTGEQIAGVLDKAKHLTDAKVQHLTEMLKHAPHRLSEHTRDFLTHYAPDPNRAGAVNPDNLHFLTEVLTKAKEAIQNAPAVEAIKQTVSEGVKTASESFWKIFAARVVAAGVPATLEQAGLNYARGKFKQRGGHVAEQDQAERQSVEQDDGEDETLSPAETGQEPAGEQRTELDDDTIDRESEAAVKELVEVAKNPASSDAEVLAAYGLFDEKMQAMYQQPNLTESQRGKIAFIQDKRLDEAWGKLSQEVKQKIKNAAEQSVVADGSSRAAVRGESGGGGGGGGPAVRETPKPEQSAKAEIESPKVQKSEDKLQAASVKSGEAGKPNAKQFPKTEAELNLIADGLGYNKNHYVKLFLEEPEHQGLLVSLRESGALGQGSEESNPTFFRFRQQIQDHMLVPIFQDLEDLLREQENPELKGKLQQAIDSVAGLSDAAGRAREHVFGANLARPSESIAPGQGEGPEIKKSTVEYPMMMETYLNEHTNFQRYSYDFANQQFVPGEGERGEMILEPAGEGYMFGLPAVANFQTRQDYHTYFAKYFDCDRIRGGKVRVVRPARFEKTNLGGYKLTAGGKGEIEIGGQ